MSKILIIAASLVLLSSTGPYVENEPPPIVEALILPFPMISYEKLLCLIEASRVSGVPIKYIAALNYAETKCGLDTEHKDKYDKGEFALHERKAYHDERVKKWGEYDPEAYADASRIAALELAEEYSYFGDWDLAFSAYTQGRRGTIRKGINENYLGRVKKYLSCDF